MSLIWILIILWALYADHQQRPPIDHNDYSDLDDYNNYPDLGQP